MWHGMFDLTKNYVKSGMTAYVELQEKEFADHDKGYTFSAHQQEVGTGYFDAVNNCIVGDLQQVLWMVLQKKNSFNFF